MKKKLLSLVKSRRFLAACASVVVICLHDLTGLSSDQGAAICGVVIAWIIGDSIKNTE